jgi:ribonuclease Z
MIPNKHKINFENCDYTITGWSKSGVRTGLYLEEFDILLDAGLYFDRKPKLILVTHGHLDHINNLYSNLLDNIKKSIVMVPSPSYNLIRNYLNAQHSVSLHKKCIFNRYKMIGLENDYTINLSKKFKIIAYAMDHSVPTIGYGINIISKKLNPNYINKSKSELIEIKKSGKMVDIINEKGFILFCGDTSSKILNDLPFYKYKYVIIECTFLVDDHYIEAYKRKHLHYLELKPFFEKYTETNFILIHFSKRYKDSFVKRFFDKMNHPNVTPFLSANEKPCLSATEKKSVFGFIKNAFLIISLICIMIYMCIIYN